MEVSSAFATRGVPDPFFPPNIKEKSGLATRDYQLPVLVETKVLLKRICKINSWLFQLSVWLTLRETDIPHDLIVVLPIQNAVTYNW